jgi:type II secretory pathway component PulK
MHVQIKKSGIALIMTLLLLVILVVLVGQFSYSTKIEAYVAQNASDDLQLQYALMSALNFALGQLQLDAMQEEGSKKKYDCLNDEWAREIWTVKKPQKIGNALVSYTISDEGAKFNLLRLLKSKSTESSETDKNKKKEKGISPEDQFDRLLETMQGKKTLIQPGKLREIIVAWMKENGLLK